MNEKMEMIKYKFNKLPKAVFSFFVINVLIFLICTFKGELLYNKGCTSVLYLKDVKQWYRLVSSTFLHADIEHLIGNMLVLYFMGEIVEKKTSVRFSIFLYFGSGIFGNLLSAWFEIYSGNYSRSIGASGACFGYLGCLISLVIYGVVRSEYISLKRVLGATLLNLMIGFSDKRINLAAHVGGLIFGLIVGVIYCVIKEYRAKRAWK